MRPILLFSFILFFSAQCAGQGFRNQADIDNFISACPDCTGLTVFDYHIYGKELDLTGLSKIENITYFYIEYHGNDLDVISLEGLSGLKNVKFFVITKLPKNGIKGIENLQEVKILTIEGGSGDLRGFESIRQLSTIELSGDFNSFEGLKGLDMAGESFIINVDGVNGLSFSALNTAVFNVDRFNINVTNSSSLDFRNSERLLTNNDVNLTIGAPTEIIGPLNPFTLESLSVKYRGIINSFNAFEKLESINTLSLKRSEYSNAIHNFDNLKEIGFLQVVDNRRLTDCMPLLAKLKSIAERYQIGDNKDGCNISDIEKLTCDHLYGLFKDGPGVRVSRIDQVTGAHSPLTSRLCFDGNWASLDQENSYYTFVGTISEGNPEKKLFTIDLNTGSIVHQPSLNVTDGSIQNLEYNYCDGKLYGMFQDKDGASYCEIDRETGQHTPKSDRLVFDAISSAIDVNSGYYYLVGQTENDYPNKRFYKLDLNSGSVLSISDLNSRYEGIDELQYNGCDEILYGLFLDNGARVSKINQESGFQGPLTTRITKSSSSSTINYNNNEFIFVGVNAPNSKKLVTRGLDARLVYEPSLSNEYEGIKALAYFNCTYSSCFDCEQNNFISPAETEDALEEKSIVETRSSLEPTNTVELPLSRVKMQEVKIFPNPARDQLNLIFQEQGVHIVELFSITGQRVHRSQTDTERYNFSITDVEAGAYIISVKNVESNSFYRSKVIIAK